MDSTLGPAGIHPKGLASLKPFPTSGYSIILKTQTELDIKELGTNSTCFFKELRTSTTNGGAEAAEDTSSILAKPHPNYEGIPPALWTHGRSKIHKWCRSKFQSPLRTLGFTDSAMPPRLKTKVTFENIMLRDAATHSRFSLPWEAS